MEAERPLLFSVLVFITLPKEIDHIEPDKPLPEGSFVLDCVYPSQ
jgi:hypothetical protein